MIVNFKDWLNKKIQTETMTSTACVASFSRPTIPMIRRSEKDKKKKST